MTTLAGVGVPLRCLSIDSDAGRCQLTAGHDGPHAVGARDAFVTWDHRGRSYWSIRKPPPWMVDLAWSAGLHPRVRGRA
jgi:hypothetical protein